MRASNGAKSAERAVRRFWLWAAGEPAESERPKRSSMACRSGSSRLPVGAAARPSAMASSSPSTGSHSPSTSGNNAPSASRMRSRASGAARSLSSRASAWRRWNASSWSALRATDASFSSDDPVTSCQRIASKVS